MRCFLREIAGRYHAAWSHAGHSYTHSLRTADRREAEVRLGPIRDTLYRLIQGTMTVPPGVDPKAFVLAGGNAAAVATADERRESRRPRGGEGRDRGDTGNAPGGSATAPDTTTAGPLTVAALAALYLDTVVSLEPTTKATATTHLGHVRRILGPDTPVATVRQSAVQGYAKTRLAQTHHGRPIQSCTVRKELQTLHHVWSWAARSGHADEGPAWAINRLDLPKDHGREPFRSYDQIDRIVRRGGLTAPEQRRLWECLYLTGDDVADLLGHARAHGTAVYLEFMTAFVALTGCRRSEMLRSRVEDWDLDAGQVMIREKKADTSRNYTTRQVDLHPHLTAVAAGWFATHPGGQHAVTEDGHPLTRNMVTDHLKRTLRKHAKWCRVAGFHTLRHSVASILASRGVDQRYIDRILGHHTEEMRKRYQHLFPQGITRAIGELLA